MMLEKWILILLLLWRANYKMEKKYINKSVIFYLPSGAKTSIMIGDAVPGKEGVTVSQITIWDNEKVIVEDSDGSINYFYRLPFQVRKEHEPS